MERYFNFPLSLMQYIKHDKDKQGLMMIIAFCVMNFSEKISYNQSSVANQIIYLHYRRPDFLTSDVRDHLFDMICNERLSEDEDYNGFTWETFNPETENGQMSEEFERNPWFYSKCVEVYRQHQAMSLFKLKPDQISDLRKMNDQVTKFIKSFEEQNGRDAWTSIHTDLFFEVYDDTIPMDHLRLIAAVKSVLNRKNLNPTYKSVLLCRMFGCKKMTMLHGLFDENPDLRAKYMLLSRRRQWESLINSAMAKGLFSFYSTGRRFLVSISMTREEIKNAVEKWQKIHIKA